MFNSLHRVRTHTHNNTECFSVPVWVLKYVCKETSAHSNPFLLQVTGRRLHAEYCIQSGQWVSRGRGGGSQLQPRVGWEDQLQRILHFPTLELELTCCRSSSCFGYGLIYFEVDVMLCVRQTEGKRGKEKEESKRTIAATPYHFSGFKNKLKKMRWEESLWRSSSFEKQQLFYFLNGSETLKHPFEVFTDIKMSFEKAEDCTTRLTFPMSRLGINNQKLLDVCSLSDMTNCLH